MKVIITIDWHTKIKPPRRDELATVGIEQVNEQMNCGYMESELNYTDNKDRDYKGWWKRKIIVD